MTATFNETVYLSMLKLVLGAGERRKNRTGTDTLAVFGMSADFDLTAGFPLITTKKVFWRGVVHELLWMLSGSSNVGYLQEHDVHIWNAWAKADYRPELGYPEGELGPVYGVQWRRWPKSGHSFNEAEYRQEFAMLVQQLPSEGIAVLRALHRHVVEKLPEERAVADFAEGAIDALDRCIGEDASARLKAVDLAVMLAKLRRKRDSIDQIAQIVDKLRHHQDDRRIILNSWNVAELDRMKLPPCHYSAQFYVDNELGLHCLMNIRSWDLFLGGPFNIAQYALLTHMLAHVSGLVPKRLVVSAGDAHIYVNHCDAVLEQLERQPRPAPSLVLSADCREIDHFTRLDQFELRGYDPHPAIKGEIAV